jgi:hypothetical protein
VNRSSVGTVAEPFQFPIELGKVREFTKSTFADHPDLQSGAVIPPTFLFSCRLWQDERTNPMSVLEMDPERSLHGEQEFVFHGPPPGVGTVLTGQARIEEIYEKEGRRGGSLLFSVIVTEFRDGAGNLVAEARQLGVETSRQPD